MHEMSLMSDLFRKIEELARQNRAKRVSTVKVRLGAFSHISADHFREHFVHGSRGTLGEGAHLVVDESTDTTDPHAQDILLESIDCEVEEDRGGS